MNFIKKSNNISSKPTILFAAYQVDRGSNGGMESATQIYESLYADYKWILLTNKESIRNERWKVLGAKVILLDYSNKYSMFSVFKFLKVLLTCLKASPDIFHANDIRSSNIILLASLLMGKPFVFTMRDTKENRDSYGLNWYIMSRVAKRIIVLSRSMQKSLTNNLQLPHSKSTVINSIVNLNEFSPKSKNYCLEFQKNILISNDRFVILVVAGFFDKKQQLEIFQKLIPKLRQFEVIFCMVGDFDPENNSYARLCMNALDELNLNHLVRFVGFSDNVQGWMSASDMILVASKREGLARCMIEGMSCGKPVISFDVCSAKEMIEDTNSGIVVNSGDWDALAEAIKFLIVNPTKSCEMSINARVASESMFDVSKSIMRWKNLYDQL